LDDVWTVLCLIYRYSIGNLTKDNFWGLCMKKAFELKGKVEAVLVANKIDSIVSVGVQKIQAIRYHGIKGDNHAGTRLTDVRERELLTFGIAKGTEIANHREFSATSFEVYAEISKNLGLLECLPIGLLGENMVFSGIPKMSELPSRSMIFFQKNKNELRSTVLVVWKVNNPCEVPGTEIELCTGIKDISNRFQKVAIGKRGIVGSVYCSGYIAEGDIVIVKIPKQKIYDPVSQ
jgi:MOSC domain-containing protein YiiM